MEVVNYLRDEAASGRRIFYPVYSQEEIRRDPSKKNVGLFFFRGEPGSRFAVVNAFALIYRVGDPFGDLARALEFIHDNAGEPGVDPDGYSLWGGSAGARMAAGFGRESVLRQLTGRSDIPQAAAVITQYTGYDSVSQDDAPAFFISRKWDRGAAGLDRTQQHDTMLLIYYTEERTQTYEKCRSG